MAMAARAFPIAEKLLLYSPFSCFTQPPTPKFAAFYRRRGHLNLSYSYASAAVISSTTTTTTTGPSRDNRKKKKEKKQKSVDDNRRKVVMESVVKKRSRTRSEKEFDEESVLRYGDTATHIPVMLGEVLEVFASLPLTSFVDCTLGAAGHSSAIIQAHPEMQIYVGLDVDPIAHGKARSRIHEVLHGNSSNSIYDLKEHIILSNFRDIKSALRDIDEKLLTPGVDGILMDLGMSSMQVNNAERGFSVLSNGPLDMRMNPQATLKAEDILNSWPDTEVGRILREYGEESNWWFLQNKIVKARQSGGLHSTGQLVDLIRNSTSRIKGGRQGWIKTATRVFQALRIAVNDELRTLEDSIYACFDCLGPGGRLAVISFHSLEDRIVKQTFLNIINSNIGDGDDDEEERCTRNLRKINDENDEKDAWIRQMIQGCNGTVLTKRPITPCEEEEKLNRRSRSSKLRVIQKAERI